MVRTGRRNTQKAYTSTWHIVVKFLKTYFLFYSSSLRGLLHLYRKAKLEDISELHGSAHVLKLKTQPQPEPFGRRPHQLYHGKEERKVEKVLDVGGGDGGTTV